MVRLLDDGVRDYVVKPFAERELVVRVRNAVLAEQTRAKMAELQKTAENANRAKDEFLAMLGHELRNPLSPILTALQLMKLRGEVGAERERAIIERQVRHLNHLVDDLLDVSRIAPDVQSRIFELFVQEGQALARSQGGLGIGLTIVRGLAELHGGSVSVRSDGVGKGSEFILRLPALATGAVNLRQPEPSRSDDRHRAAPSAAARVLVVDDNEDAARLLVDVLTQRGYQAWVAMDGPAALEVAKQTLPDIAILDLGLPVMDGYDLATELRRLPGLEDVQLIAVTGYGQEVDRQRTGRAGVRHHLVKPLDISTLDRALNDPHADEARA